MKNFLFCMIVVLGMTSCLDNTKSYSYEEMQTFIALKQARIKAADLERERRKIIELIAQKKDAALSKNLKRSSLL